MKSFQNVINENRCESFSHLETKSNPNGKTYIIGDIHGCINSFESLISQISIGKSDKIILVGDYINKGPDSCGVLLKIFDLIEKGIDIIPLRGNHEEMAIEIYNEKKYWSIPQFSELNKSDQDKIKLLMTNLPVYCKLNNDIVVHAGLDFEKENYLLDKQSMLWIREFYAPQNLEFTVFHGHDPMYIQQIIRQLEEPTKSINLDNGCVFKNKFYLGNLIAYCYEEKEFISQKNLE